MRKKQIPRGNDRKKSNGKDKQEQRQGQKQIPRGNDRKKSNGKDSAHPEMQRKRATAADWARRSGCLRLRRGLDGGGLGGFVGLGGDGVRGVGGFGVGFDVVVDALHALFEAAETFAEALTELR